MNGWQRWSSEARWSRRPASWCSTRLPGGAALDTFTKPDPSVVRALTEASLAMTAFSFLPTALFLVAVSYAILATRALPRWTGWLAVGIAILNLVAVPATFGGNDFMEAVVAGVTASGWYVYINDVRGLAYIGWLIGAGISMMRVKLKAVAPALHERELQKAG